MGESGGGGVMAKYVVPDGVKDLLDCTIDPIRKAAIIEAYRRGRAEALQEFLAEMLRREGGEK